MKKKYYLFLKVFFILFLFIPTAHAQIKNKLINKIEGTHTLFFEFQQQINDKVENGSCNIRYPKLIRCEYEDSYKKLLISNGKTLAIIQRKYKKIFYYSLKNTPLNFILDKEYLIDFIKNNEPEKIDEFFIKYKVQENEKNIYLFFDTNSLHLKAWKTKDIYENNVEFLISNLKINVPLEDNLFKIPSVDNF